MMKAVYTIAAILVFLIIIFMIRTAVDEANHPEKYQDQNHQNDAWYRKFY